jgi:hypothetical protein
MQFVRFIAAHTDAKRASLGGKPQRAFVAITASWKIEPPLIGWYADAPAMYAPW